jgi:photosystem II stability/assembly factor-like uncharacterized protein
MNRSFPMSILSLLTGFVILLSFNKTVAQDWQKDIENDSNFFSIQKAFYNDPDRASGKTEEEDGPDELYKRWEHFMMPRVNAQGNPMAPNIIYKEWTKYKASQIQYKKSFKNGDWTYVGPIVAPGNAGGTGRINCLRFQPGNPQTMWAGTPSGGLWKTTDMGKTWATNTDNIPNLGVTDIAINPRNTDTMFMASGDGYGYGINNGTYFGGSYSNGIMRSVDGGNTWDTTSLNFDRTKARQIYRVIVYPENPNIVIALTNNGIWRSKNGGNTWKNVSTDPCSDIKMNARTHSTMYSGGSSFYISKDTGATWQRVIVKLAVPTGAMVIATTPANDSTIYLLLLQGHATSGNTAVMRSLDGGYTWKTMSNITALTKFYGYYTSSFAVSPFNPNQVTVGGLNVFRSSDSGMTWSQITYDNAFPSTYYVHADHRVFEYYPGSKDTVFDGDDGGLYMSPNGGLSWKLISNDIHALELYRIGSGSDASILYTGAQDNGVNQLYNGNWKRVIGGDGMTCQVSWDDPSVGYGSWQNGNLQKTVDYGRNWSILYPPSAGSVNWTAPFVVDPGYSNILYFGGSKLYQSIDGGSAWNSISDPIKSPSNISNIAVAPGDNKTIYISMGSEQNAPLPRLYSTINGGTSWTNISKGINVVTGYLTNIAVDRRDPKHLAVSFAGYNSGQKVYISKDGGTNFTNISTGLPNVPVNCVAFESSTENGIYVGTDVGVFYRNDNTGGWVAYDNGLPNVIINQIEIFPSLYKIRVATYGRGIWDGSLTGNISGIEKIASLQKEIKVYPNPSINGIFSVELPGTPYRTPIISVYNMMGQKMADKKLAPDDGGNGASIDLSTLQNGIYFISFNYPDGVVSKKVQILK